MATFPRDNRSYATNSALDRAVEFTQVDYELLGYGLLVLASVVAHLWALGHMAMHHDESIHAWMSWKFFTGAGGFVCAGGRTAATYCYDPVYHGPALYVLTLISYFLFGVGEAQARLPQALAGITLVASCWMLRPLAGRRAAFGAAVILAFAPSILYYTRFARHDGLMLLWEFWVVVGFFRFLFDGKSRWLYLLAAGAALAVATHELYYILIFLFGFFVLLRLATERWPNRTVMIGLGALLGVAVVADLVVPLLGLNEKFGGIALLVGTVAAMGLLIQRVWDTRPVLTPRFLTLWNEQRNTVWGALGLLLVIYVLLFSVFFTDPLGVVEGAYRGISYWLGSQQEFARGKQPWYYYLMLMPIYEPLGFFGAISVTVALLAQTGVKSEQGRVKSEERADDDPHAEAEQDGGLADADGDEFTVPYSLSTITTQMFPLFLAFWFVGALVAFSWAGEKMPWLVTHIALPGNLLIAWGLGQLIGWIDWRDLPRRAALIPAVLLLLAVAVGVVLWRFSPNGGEGIEAQTWFLAGIVPLIVAGFLIYALLTLAQRIGRRTSFLIGVLTVAALLSGYMVRATWMAVYDHPDTPRELLVYTQSSPDVPNIVAELNELSITQTRNTRTAGDPTGGHSMPVIMDIGDTSGDGSLAWPFQWYLRDYQRLESRNADFFRTANANSFEVQKSGATPGVKELAPVVMAYSQHLTPSATQALEQHYVKRYDTKLNWWFPEGDLSGCNPAVAGYKQFYYSTLTVAQARADKDCAALDFSKAQYSSPLAPIAWPLDRANWPTIWKFVMWREFPSDMHIDGRQMQVWVRKDLAPGAGTTSASAGGDALRLLAEQAFGSQGNGNGQLSEPRGVAIDSKGNLYVADMGNNRVVVYKPDGSPLRTIGSFGTGDGQFNEPRGLAIDGQDNLYVTDTWNARVEKFDASGSFVKAWGEGKQDFGNGRKATATDRSEAGNKAEKLGLFGPRGIAVDKDGSVYIADTGNRRIVVTDNQGNFRYQFGYEGTGDGQFTEPIGVAVDDAGNLYVADTWNGRVQMFAKAFETQNVGPLPSAHWTVAGWEPNTYDDPYIAVGTGGKVYLTVPGSNQAVYTSASGDTLLRWGGKGTDFASMTLPSGIAVGPDRNVYIVDRGNGRVLRYHLPEIAPPPSGP